MVGIAQLVERLVVVQEVAGSSPVTHPMNWPTLEEFEAMVVEALDLLPDEMVEGLDNVVFLVENDHLQATTSSACTTVLL